jgi:hypothetical protein
LYEHSNNLFGVIAVFWVIDGWLLPCFTQNTLTAMNKKQLSNNNENITWF